MEVDGSENQARITLTDLVDAGIVRDGHIVEFRNEIGEIRALLQGQVSILFKNQELPSLSSFICAVAHKRSSSGKDYLRLRLANQNWNDLKNRFKTRCVAACVCTCMCVQNVVADCMFFSKLIAHYKSEGKEMEEIIPLLENARVGVSH